jgi:hypothetical protein
VRALPALERTDTMKFVKRALQEEGFAESAAPLWMRDADAGTYAPLDAARRAALAAGALRL